MQHLDLIWLLCNSKRRTLAHLTFGFTQGTEFLFSPSLLSVLFSNGSKNRRKKNVSGEANTFVGLSCRATLAKQTLDSADSPMSLIDLFDGRTNVGAFPTFHRNESNDLLP